MRMNDVFTCLDKWWNGNQISGHRLKLRMITRVVILIWGYGNEILIP